MKLNLNGIEQAIESPPLTPLLHVLREELGITSPKAGCQQGGCGACTVLVSGIPRRSCLTPVAAVNGSEVTTLEGLGTPEALSPVQAAFHEHYAAQCGFCTSGMVLASHAYVQAGGGAERESIQAALSGHVCRCTGYVKILDAVTAAAGGEVTPTQRWITRVGEEAPMPIVAGPAPARRQEGSS
jgi:aerobic-type carbon monoxide dehydrogenase small subunit (CoxS/CutS family)